MTPPPSRDNLILDHIGLYRLTFRRVLEKMFFAGNSSDNVVQRLIDQGRIQSQGGLPGRLRYYQLTVAEAESRGVPVARARPLKSQALHQALATLWYCCMTRSRRVRLEPRDLAQLIPGFPEAPQAAHCLDAREHASKDSPFQHRILRLEVAGPRTGVTGLVQRLTGRVHEARRHPALAAWVEGRHYGYVVLADAPARRRLIEQAIRRAGLHELASVSVAFAPTPVTLAAAIAKPLATPSHAPD